MVPAGFEETPFASEWRSHRITRDTFPESRPARLAGRPSEAKPDDAGRSRSDRRYRRTPCDGFPSKLECIRRSGPDDPLLERTAPPTLLYALPPAGHLPF